MEPEADSEAGGRREERFSCRLAGREAVSSGPRDRLDGIERLFTPRGPVRRVPDVIYVRVEQRAYLVAGQEPGERVVRQSESLFFAAWPDDPVGDVALPVDRVAGHQVDHLDSSCLVARPPLDLLRDTSEHLVLRPGNRGGDSEVDQDPPDRDGVRVREDEVGEVSARVDVLVLQPLPRRGFACPGAHVPRLILPRQRPLCDQAEHVEAEHLPPDRGSPAEVGTGRRVERQAGGCLDDVVGVRRLLPTHAGPSRSESPQDDSRRPLNRPETVSALRHHRRVPSHPSVFLSGETRQVWALRRDNGEPVYLPEGQADAMREMTKRDLRCPYPGCDAQISTRGGSRRAHFFHVSKVEHHGGRESEFHLAAKAMLAQWLRSAAPEGATVREEQTIKDPAISLHRRPDVLVTGQSGSQVAYEVEYKAWSVDGWRLKQTDLDRAGPGGSPLPTLWLFGHTRLRLQAEGGDDAVSVPELLMTVAATHPVLVINPATKEIGTLVKRSGAPYRGNVLYAHLKVDPLDACRFDRHLGLVTPSLQRALDVEPVVAAHEAEMEAKRAALKVTAAKEPARHRAPTERDWARSPLRKRLIEDYGEVPTVFDEHERRWGRPAEPAHWHAVIHYELVVTGERFSLDDIYDTLARHRIKPAGPYAAMSLRRWLERLRHLGMVRFETPGGTPVYRGTGDDQALRGS